MGVVEVKVFVCAIGERQRCVCDCCVVDEDPVGFVQECGWYADSAEPYGAGFAGGIEAYCCAIEGEAGYCGVAYSLDGLFR